MKRNKPEQFLCTMIAIILASIAVGVFVKQNNFAPELYPSKPTHGSAEIVQKLPAPTRRIVEFSNVSVVSTATNDMKDLGAEKSLSVYASDRLVEMGAAESFDKNSLSDKIDGKADLYLRAGFKALISQRFSLKENNQAWTEIFVYDMLKPLNAFAVYSQQKRADSVNRSDIGSFAYETSESLFCVVGKYYLEMTSSAVDETLQKQLLDFAQKFEQQAAIEQDESHEMSLFKLFPVIDGKQPEYKYVPDNVFGCDKLTSVVCGEYDLGVAQKMTLFCAKENSPELASEVSSAFAKMYDDLGADRLESVSLERATGAWAVDELGAVTIGFTSGNMVMGARQAPNLDLAIKFASEFISLKEKFTDESK